MIHTDGTKLIDKWDEFKVLCELVELEIMRAANGNVSAARRARKGLMQLKPSIGEFRKILNDISKQTRTLRSQSKETPSE
jgi:hypothetical protein